MKKIKDKTVLNFSRNIYALFAFIFVLFLLFYGVNIHFTEKTISAKAEVKNDKIVQIPTNIRYNHVDQYRNIECNKDVIQLPEIEFLYKNRIFYVDDIPVVSARQQMFISKGIQSRNQVMNFAISNGFSEKDAVLYAYPELINCVNKIAQSIYKEPIDAKIENIENSAKTTIVDHKNGCELDENKLFLKLFDELRKNKGKYQIDVSDKNIPAKITTKQAEKVNILRSTFSTSFASSNEQRKNNIKNALSCFDGIVLNPGEILSFNKTTGPRTEENGYQKAKIIKNGTFIQEFGGGVCQVSTTLYNAALLADLEIIQANTHSLPVSYVEPGFDAMVSGGSSDLVIKNNLEYPIMITTCDKNNNCKISIYGQKNNFQIIKKSEKLYENPNFEKIETTCYEDYGFSKPLEEGERYIVSRGRPGYTAQSWLEYHVDGILVKTKKLRTVTYNPVKEVILISEKNK